MVKMWLIVCHFTLLVNNTNEKCGLSVTKRQGKGGNRAADDSAAARTEKEFYPRLHNTETNGGYLCVDVKTQRIWKHKKHMPSKRRWTDFWLTRRKIPHATPMVPPKRKPVKPCMH